MRFGKIVQMVRKERGLTQTELAFRLGITGAYLSEIENGRKLPPIDRTIEIARTLNVNVERFVLERLNDQMPEGYVVVRTRQEQH
jgi:putative transcriptional regulator